MEFSVESLKSAQIALNKLRSYKSNLLGEINDQYRQEFIDKMTDNLATPEALALVWKMLKSDLSSEDKWATLLDFDRLLGLNLDKGVVEEVIPKNILELVEKRKQAREDKNWTESDYLRKVIEGEGYLVEDLTDSCKIRKIK
jgi:cysteinyl-tRNA synthetase